MSKPRGRSINDPRPGDLRTLEGARIGDVAPEGPSWRIPHFEVQYQGETFRIRYGFDNEKLEAWVKDNKGALVTLVVFPYRWQVGEKTGVVYNFQSLEIIKESK